MWHKEKPRQRPCRQQCIGDDNTKDQRKYSRRRHSSQLTNLQYVGSPTTISTWVLRLFGLLIPVFLVLGVDWQIRRRDEESNDIWKKRKRLALDRTHWLSQAENNPAELSKVFQLPG